jgi:CcmD family protein
MDGGVGFLLAAFLVTGLVLLLYAVNLLAGINRLRREVETLKRGEADSSEPFA